MKLLRRLIARDEGQDMIEYALLTAAIGFIAVATFAALSDNINDVYTSWDTNINDLWEPEDPQ
jgi:Flp pilus assembly pilin Flp